MAQEAAPSFNSTMVGAGGQGGSPNTMYTFFLLQQAARHQWIMSTNEDNFYNIERSCLSLISFCPNRDVRVKLIRDYETRKQNLIDDPNHPLSKDAAIVSAAIFAVGQFVDYLNVALELTEDAYGSVI